MREGKILEDDCNVEKERETGQIKHSKKVKEERKRR